MYLFFGVKKVKNNWNTWATRLKKLKKRPTKHIEADKDKATNDKNAIRYIIPYNFINFARSKL